MNRKKIFIVVATLVFSCVTYAQRAGFLSGVRVDYDDKTGHTVVKQARINGEEGLYIKSGKAEFTVDQNETPRSIELSGGVQFQSGNSSGSADRAVYYPELQLLSAPQISFMKGPAAASTSYTCSGGTLYANGSSTGGGSTCSNLGGGGSVEIRCGGSGGNSVNMIHRMYSCAGG